MKIAVCGPGRSGKDTVSHWLREHTTLRYVSSTSEAAAQLCFTQLKDRYGYTSVDEAFKDRHNHRVEWANVIWEYNKPYGITLYEEMLDTNDILNGIRRSGEIRSLQQHRLIDLTIWIDRPNTNDPSCEMDMDDADIVIRNHTSFTDLYRRLTNFAKVARILR